MQISKDERLRQVIALRRDFHKFPESGWLEFRTTAKIAEALSVFGYKLHFPCDIVNKEDIMGRASEEEIRKAEERAEMQGANKKILKRMNDITGLVAELNTERQGPVTVLRFDIDCVDIAETGDTDHIPNKLGFASQNNNCMHACGHDGHIAIGIILAEILAKERNKLCGTVRFVFQPAEEGVRGGYAMVKSGIVDDADYFIATHLGLGLPTGTVCCGACGFLQTTKFDAEFTGVAAHAAKEPEKGRNALLAAASAAIAIHKMPKCPYGKAMANVGVLNAGVGRNVIAPNALMKVETRGENEQSASFAYNYCIKSLHEAAESFGVKIVISKQGVSIAADSDAVLSEIVSQCASSVPEVRERLMNCELSVSDDACWYMKHVQSHNGKCSYICIGADVTAGHHSDKFDFDESAMVTAADVLEKVVSELNKLTTF
jgi:aminobenzoyl-glutamate utilization protein A